MAAPTRFNGVLLLKRTYFIDVKSLVLKSSCLSSRFDCDEGVECDKSLPVDVRVTIFCFNETVSCGFGNANVTSRAHTRFPSSRHVYNKRFANTNVASCSTGTAELHAQFCVFSMQQSVIQTRGMDVVDPTLDDIRDRLFDTSGQKWGQCIARSVLLSSMLTRTGPSRQAALAEAQAR